MRTSRLSLGSLVALGLAGLLVACDKTPTAPGPPNVQQPPPPPTPVLARVEVTGPSSIPPNETGQFTATGIYSDGSRRDVTNQSTWRTSRASVLSISATGLATGHDRGEASVTASFSNRSATKGDVIVVPAGTYRLIGNVRDAGVPVFDARVEVSAGAAEGLSTTANGSYRLYGVFGDSEIRVTKDGYEEQKKSLQFTSHQTLDFDLALSRPRDMVAGTYTLTITAAVDCPAALPNEARMRTYTAVVTQDGPRLTTVLQGTNFYRNGNQTLNSFRGVVEPDRVTFQLAEPFFYYYYYNYYPDVFEQLTTSTYYSVGGSIVTTGSSSRRSGTLNGLIGTYDAPPRFRPLASCRSNSHRFELSR